MSVALSCAVTGLADPLERLLGDFAVEGWPDGFVATAGRIDPFESRQVMRHISPYAHPVPRPDQILELYQDGERFWVVDDRWGMAEIDLREDRFRSWLLPEPVLDPLACAEMAALWPLAQLLPRKGLHLLPSLSIVRDGLAVLILCPFGLQPETEALIGAGWRVIGQRWTALREEDGRLALLEMPGSAVRPPLPRVAHHPAVLQPRWTDLTADSPATRARHAFCQAALVVDTGRRGSAGLRRLGASAAVNVLRRAWPILELHPHRGYAKLPLKLARHCQVCELQLPANPGELPAALESLRRPVTSVFVAGKSVSRSAAIA